MGNPPGILRPLLKCIDRNNANIKIMECKVLRIVKIRNRSIVNIMLVVSPGAYLRHNSCSALWC